MYKALGSIPRKEKQKKFRFVFVVLMIELSITHKLDEYSTLSYTAIPNPEHFKDMKGRFGVKETGSETSWEALVIILGKSGQISELE
jgi:hypothetical protein